MGNIFVVMGKSATGKDTIYKHLLLDSELDLKTVVTYTTRPIRSSEQNGVEYFFVTNEKWQLLFEEGKIIESRTYHTMLGDWHYFTVQDSQIDLSVANYVLISTLEGYEQIRKYYGETVVIPIYVEVEDGIRLQRAITREQKQKTPRYDEVCRRFLADQKDFSEENIECLGIIKRYQNVVLEDCLTEIVEDIKKLL